MKVQVPSFIASSIALQVTVVIPEPKFELEAGTQEGTISESIVSVTDGSCHDTGFSFSMVLEGHVIEGATWSVLNVQYRV